MKAVQHVDLWICPLVELNQDADIIRELKSWLSDDELRKVSRFRQPQAQLTALYVRSMLRGILSRYSPIQPQHWVFEYGEKGKPRLSNLQRTQTGLEFNLSHSKDYLLIAVLQSDDESLMLGTDIEHSRESTDIHAIMTHYFAAQEINDLNVLPLEKQRDRFFDLWALKESYIKATGKGLATSLKQFYFDFNQATPHCVSFVDNDNKSNTAKDLVISYDITVHFTPEHQKSHKNAAANWQSYLGRLDDQYRIAVTLGGSERQIELKGMTFDPSQLVIR
ncbi:4'-phosphopantetheinyl transferase family protein [Vibrio methylphosphonaticus]|uniref:4'-phosphopantetheinyl transferase family protein n=1 Tax=Vibrio methylphosphonaticus TaxID=2946866 RepID=UPI00202A24EA|nr:4'-phosphopantetheinyl transferase superfamily protein [Vibrio methylphosphonaticus]MCL9773982.1 4'-phosphopantetheinyl transferase superfamily protein [Vibrio methylphosphonaticus]